MKAADAIIAWTPETADRNTWGDTVGRLEVGPCWPADTDWLKPYQKTVGACFGARRTATGWEQAAKVFMDFQGVVMSGIAVEVAHAEFLKIDEYRWMIGPDMPGAEEGPSDFYDSLKATSSGWV